MVVSKRAMSKILIFTFLLIHSQHIKMNQSPTGIVNSGILTMFLSYGETKKYEDLEKMVLANHAMPSGRFKT